MSDEAHEWTDEQIADLQKTFRDTFEQAASEMRDKLDQWMRDYDSQRQRWEEDLEQGNVTKRQYKEWRSRMASDLAWQQDMIEQLSRDATYADAMCVDAINDRLPSVYGENANYAAYEVDSKIGYDTKFTMYDQDTVRRLLMERPDLYPTAKVDVEKDILWNRRRFASAITQGVLQGESIPNMAKRLMRVFEMDEKAAVRAARTACTAAENLGRISSHQRAKSMGIELESLWIATLDMRTRATHRELDMRHVPVGSKFKTFTGVELRCPGDPSCTVPGEIYNCRCTLGVWTPHMDLENAERWSRLPDNMTYDDWKNAAKSRTNEPQSEDRAAYTQKS